MINNNNSTINSGEMFLCFDAAVQTIILPFTVAIEVAGHEYNRAVIDLKYNMN